MDSFKSDIVNINADINDVFARLANPGALEGLVEQLPEDAKAKIQNVSFTEDSIKVKADPVGEIALEITERTQPTRVVYTATTSPLPFSLTIELEETGVSMTNASASIDIALNPFIKPMLKKPLTDAAKKFGELLAIIPY